MTPSAPPALRAGCPVPAASAARSGLPLDPALEGLKPEDIARMERKMQSVETDSRGAPGLLLPLYRPVPARARGTKAKIDPLQVEEILERWDMP